MSSLLHFSLLYMLSPQPLPANHSTLRSVTGGPLERRRQYRLSGVKSALSLHPARDHVSISVEAY
jgi:hypothetical protein